MEITEKDNKFLKKSEKILNDHSARPQQVMKQYELLKDYEFDNLDDDTLNRLWITSMNLCSRQSEFEAKRAHAIRYINCIRKEYANL